MAKFYVKDRLIFIWRNYFVEVGSRCFRHSLLMSL